MSDLEIRRFEADDGPAVRDLHETALRDAGDFAEDAPEPDLDDVAGHYLEPAGAEFLVGTLDDSVVAMGAYHPVAEWILAGEVSVDEGSVDGAASVDDAVAELTRMRVAPGHQREGFGAAMYARLERRARADGYEAFVLDVNENNDTARAFYEDLGFDYLATVSLQALDRTIRLAAYRKPI